MESKETTWCSSTQPASPPLATLSSTVLQKTNVLETTTTTQTSAITMTSVPTTTELGFPALATSFENEME